MSYTTGQLGAGLWLINESNGELFNCFEAESNIKVMPNAKHVGTITLTAVCPEGARCPIRDLCIVFMGHAYRCTLVSSFNPSPHGVNRFDVTVNVEAWAHWNAQAKDAMVKLMNKHMKSATAGIVPQQKTPQPAPAVPPQRKPFRPGLMKQYAVGTRFECVSISKNTVASWTLGTIYEVHFGSTGDKCIKDDIGTEWSNVDGMEVVTRAQPAPQPASAPVAPSAQGNAPTPRQAPPVWGDNPFDEEPTQTGEPSAPDNWDRMAAGGKPQRESKEWQPDELRDDIDPMDVIKGMV